MEGGTTWFDYLTYGVIGAVLLALALLLLRTTTFFLSLLAVPLTDALGRWRGSRDLVTRWGERGAAAQPDVWREPAASDAPSPASPARGTLVPRAVQRGLRIGAALGAVPGVVLAVTGAMRERAAGAATGDLAMTIGMALGLVAAAGALLGGALGALAGAGWDAWRTRH